MSNEQIAQIAHAANTAYCAVNGDFSHKPWEHLPQELKDSTVAGVVAIKTDPNVTPQQLHKSWRDFKEVTGWTYGPVKDLEKRTHPNLVDWESLSEEQRMKDKLFGVIVKTLLESS